ncbi:hypothetical protein OIV83_004374 [Microbotryomycetes sp. JL201]|nr:hypothetical protein OIV83_004374 [Microbotryomycetes sp. JL201]
MADGTAQQPQQATKIACTGCRRIKVKCLPVLDHFLAPSRCKRCTRLNLECEYLPQRRPTKKEIHPTSSSTWPSRDSNGNASQTDERPKPEAGPSRPAFPSAGDMSGFSSIKFGRMNIMTPATSTYVDGHSLPLLLKAKEAKSPAEAKRVGEMGNVFFDKCPVEIGSLGIRDAEILLDEFMRYLNPFIKLFDPKLHTITFLRSSSTPLFSAIMTASSKYFLPSMFPKLLDHTNEIIGQGFVRGVGDIGFLQAICVLVFWKESDDPTAFFKVGYAMRLAQALVLNERRSGQLPADDTAARLVLNRERTWRNLIAFDHTYRLSYGQDGNGMHAARTTTRGLVIDPWIDETRPYGVVGDELLSYNMTLSRMFSVCDDLEQAHSDESVSLLYSLAKSELDTLQRRVMKRVPDECQPDTPGENYCRFAVLRGRCRLLKALLLKRGLDDKFVVVDYLSAVAAYVKCAEQLARVGHMRFIQDTFAVGLFKLAEFLAQLFPYLTGEQQQLVLSWLNHIHDACREAKQGSETIAPAYVERFYKLVIKSLHPTFEEAVVDRDPALNPENLADLRAAPTAVDDVLTARSSASAPPHEAIAPVPLALNDITPSVDAAYWSSLFPDLDADQWAAWFNEIAQMPIE